MPIQGNPEVVLDMSLLGITSLSIRFFFFLKVGQRKKKKEEKSLVLNAYFLCLTRITSFGYNKPLCSNS
jgi:hypothetical protein